MTERSDAPLADEPQPGAAPNDMPADVPSGLPDDVEDEDTPLGPAATEPDSDRGPMPGIPSGGDEPDSAG